MNDIAQQVIVALCSIGVGCLIAALILAAVTGLLR